jgi:hypothetical protein
MKGQISPPNVVPPPTTDRQPDPSPRPADDVPVWMHGPTAYTVRACALSNAVELCKSDPDTRTSEVLTVAADFERYLQGGDPDAS